MNFDETESKRKSDHTSDNEVKIFCETSVVIEEEWFDDMNLTDHATFPIALIKHAKNLESTKIMIIHVTQSNTYAKL